MANRALLHKTALEGFRKWLERQGYTILVPKGNYEVLRWQGEATMPMPIVFRKNEMPEHYSCNNEAARYVQRYLSYKD